MKGTIAVAKISGLVYRDKNGIGFYKTLKDNGDALRIPHVVSQALKCVLVIPASNADPERSFSAPNRLTRGERSGLGTKTSDSLMRVHRDGPSVLTVTPKTLARQRLNPLPDLGPPHAINLKFRQLHEEWGRVNYFRCGTRSCEAICPAFYDLA